MTDSTAGSTRRGVIASAIVAGGVVAWLGLVSLAIADLTYHWFGLVALVVFGACWMASRKLIGDIAERRVDEVDEYELDQRHRARNVGYIVTMAALMVLFFYLTVLTNVAQDSERAPLEQAPGLVFATFLLSAATPSFLLAWRLRSQPHETDEHDLIGEGENL